LPLNDSVFWALGNRFVRQLIYRPKTGVTVQWEKKYYMGDFVSVIPSANGGCRALTNQGHIVTFAANGDSLGVVKLPIAHFYQSLIEQGNNLVVCGGTTAGVSKVLKINANGNIVWDSLKSCKPTSVQKKSPQLR
jgi:hypothetical protein